MNYDKILDELVSKAINMPICPICGTPYRPFHSLQKTCGADECKKEWHRQYLKERRLKLLEEDREAYNKYHAAAVKRWRHKKKALEKRDEQLKEISDRYQKQEDFDNYIKEHGHEYGKLQAEKTLAGVPKIDVNLEGGDKSDE